MMYLPRVIKDINFMARLTRQMEIDTRYLTVGDAIRITRHIEYNLEPEILAQDGERSEREYMAEKTKLMGAARELKEKGFRIPRAEAPNIAAFNPSLVK